MGNLWEISEESLVVGNRWEISEKSEIIGISEEITVHYTAGGNFTTLFCTDCSALSFAFVSLFLPLGFPFVSLSPF
jgi:hypothetical protein